MPNIFINVIEGLTQEQKNNMVTRVTEVASKDVGVPKTSVKIVISEHAPKHIAIGGEFLEKSSNVFYPIVFVNTKSGKGDEMLKNLKLHIAEAIAETCGKPVDKITVYFIEHRPLQ